MSNKTLASMTTETPEPIKVTPQVLSPQVTYTFFDPVSDQQVNCVLYYRQHEDGSLSVESADLVTKSRKQLVEEGK